MAVHFHICEDCKGSIKNDRAASWFPPGSRQPLLFCSFGCRRRYINDRPTPPRALPADNAAKGVNAGGKPARKKSPSEIRRKMRPTESAISTAIGNTFDGAGVWNTRIQSGMIKTASGHMMKLARKGTPDRIAAAGLIVFVEVKRQGERPSAEQLATIAALQANGALCVVLDDPDDSECIVRALKAAEPEIERINAGIREIQARLDAAVQARRELRQNGNRIKNNAPIS